MSKAVWTVFYGYNELNSSIFSLLIFSQIPLAFCSVMVNTNQAMTNTKATVTALLGSLFLKIILNIPMMRLFNTLGLEAYFATITLNIIIDFIESIYLMREIWKKTKIDFTMGIRSLIKTSLCTVIMILALSILNVFVPNYSTSRILSILIILLYGVVGVLVYFIMAYKSKTLTEILGQAFIDKMFLKIKRFLPRSMVK